MPGRFIPPESTFAHSRFDDPTLAWRRSVLRETVRSWELRGEQYREAAARNLARWSTAAKKQPAGPPIRVVGGDWGEVTARFTRTWGQTFAVLNMANAYYPGGAYVEGTAAQEENMFRRTDCHFSVSDRDLDAASGRYRAEWSALMNGDAGRVYLDVSQPRTCVRGPELSADERRGYEWLSLDDVFPFFELRAAARDYRDGSRFDPEDARRRVQAQLATLIDAGVAHAVLGASGCGAFCNPPREIARIYREEIERLRDRFRCIVFAIYHAGYGPRNYEPFKEVLEPDGP